MAPNVLTDPLWRAERDFPTREAAVHGEERVTYRDLADQVRATSNALRAAGAQPGQVVAVLSAPRPEFMAAFLAIAEVDCTYLGLSPKAPDAELTYQLEVTGAVAIIATTPDGVPQAERLAGESHIAVLRTESGRPSAGAEWLLSGTNDTRIQLPDRETLAAIVFTSGSTGRPKGALLPRAGFAQAVSIQNDQWLSPLAVPSRTVLLEPINHVAAVAEIAWAMLAAGGTVIYQSQFDAKELLDLIADEQVNFWYADPAVLVMCRREPRWSEGALNSVQHLVWSGGRLPADVTADVYSAVPRVSTSWGMTETVASMIFTEPDADVETLSTCLGKPHPAYQVAVRTDVGTVVNEPPNTACAGELLVGGEHLAIGYLTGEGEPVRPLAPRGEWFATGDIVEWHPDGNLVLVGRRNDMYKSGGENVMPREVEQALESHPSVRAAVVVGVPHPVWGEVGHAFVLPVHGAEVETDELRSHLRLQLARFKVPKRIEVTTDLPLLSSGKFDRRALRQRALSVTNTEQNN